MNKNKLTKVALACTAYMNTNAQEKTYPKQKKMKPGMSEYWTPQPKVVTPGNIQTNSAPSDAIILFDGKDLSAWESAKDGGAAEWDVHDGVFTVNKKKGDILTKQAFENFQLHINGMYLQISQEKVKVVEIVVYIFKICMKFKFWIATTMKLM